MSSTVSEATPLLHSTTESPAQANEPPVIKPISNENDNDGEDDTPLPKLQIFFLCFARLVEPLAFFSIFPFINKMILEVGEIEQSDVGFYSGLIESCFSLTQMLLMITWGRAADRIGRKPVLVFSLSGVAIAIALFGLSGALQSPAEQYPGVFGNILFFKEYPYALPTFATGGIAAVAAIFVFFFVNETLKPEDKNEIGVVESPMTTWELIKYPGSDTVPGVYYEPA
ncbi:hypothetical protein B7494_g4949 [Chlorociboria aeruginascens]|nr:hypothetical protein B7494_g4949 [Chlorociboria aeruginascens]